MMMMTVMNGCLQVLTFYYYSSEGISGKHNQNAVAMFQYICHESTSSPVRLT